MTENPYRSSAAEQSEARRPRRTVSLILLIAVLLQAGVILVGVLAVTVSRTTAPVAQPVKRDGFGESGSLLIADPDHMQICFHFPHSIELFQTVLSSLARQQRIERHSDY